MFENLSDELLLQEERHMRVKAWDAPKSLPGTYNDAHARFGAEWCELHREVRRRGLTPSTADTAFRPREAREEIA